MQIDKITFNDISVFQAEEEFSIFHKLNFTRTQGGKEWLRRFFYEPHSDVRKIIGTQNIIKTIIDHISEWPAEITNGTIIMIDKFLDYNLDPIPRSLNAVNSFTFKILQSADYSMIKYSVRHFADFYRGMHSLAALLSSVELPASLRFYIARVNKLLVEEPLKKLAHTVSGNRLSIRENLY